MFNVTVFAWFTNIEKVQDAIRSVLPYFMAALLPDCWQGYM